MGLKEDKIMRQKDCTRQQVGRGRKAEALVAAGSVLAAGTLFSGGVSAQEVLPTPPAPVQGADRAERERLEV